MTNSFQKKSFKELSQLLAASLNVGIVQNVSIP